MSQAEIVTSASLAAGKRGPFGAILSNLIVEKTNMCFPEALLGDMLSKKPGLKLVL